MLCHTGLPIAKHARAAENDVRNIETSSKQMASFTQVTIVCVCVGLRL